MFRKEKGKLSLPTELPLMRSIVARARAHRSFGMRREEEQATFYVRYRTDELEK